MSRRNSRAFGDHNHPRVFIEQLPDDYDSEEEVHTDFVEDDISDMSEWDENGEEEPQMEQYSEDDDGDQDDYYDDERGQSEQSEPHQQDGFGFRLHHQSHELHHTIHSHHYKLLIPKIAAVYRAFEKLSSHPNLRIQYIDGSAALQQFAQADANNHVFWTDVRHVMFHASPYPKVVLINEQSHTYQVIINPEQLDQIIGPSAASASTNPPPTGETTTSGSASTTSTTSAHAQTNPHHHHQIHSFQSTLLKTLETIQSNLTRLMAHSKRQARRIRKTELLVRTYLRERTNTRVLILKDNNHASTKSKPQNNNSNNNTVINPIPTVSIKDIHPASIGSHLIVWDKKTIASSINQQKSTNNSSSSLFDFINDDNTRSPLGKDKDQNFKPFFPQSGWTSFDLTPTAANPSAIKQSSSSSSSSVTKVDAGDLLHMDLLSLGGQ